MLFMHTIDMVLAGTKTATSRLWKEDWEFFSSTINTATFTAVRNAKRRLYYRDQILSVQPKRGAKGVAKIRILELQKRDVRTYSESEILAEGYGSALEFYKTWYGMHFPAYVKLLADGYVDYDWWLDSMRGQTPEKNTALFIRFELQDGQS